ncbi:MAG: HlyD family type I secretion periplasmic adaptor subunit [Oceanospirillaceae bacterium]|nr:HlyD family type I secretion periplasmic adaptor subunit [Oceanospirillaceae bacterium]
MNVNEELNSNIKAETDDMPTRIIGMIIVLVVFVGFGGWAATAPIDSAALAPGVVTVAGNRKTIQHLEGGIINQFHVKDGDSVKVGDPLLLLDDTQPRAELQILKGQLFVWLAQEARFVAERDDKPEVLFSDALLVDDPRAKEARDLEVEQFKVRRVSRDGEIEVLQQRVEQLHSQVDGLKALINSKRTLIKSYDEEIEDNVALLSQGFVDKQRLRDLQRLKESLIGEVSEHSASIAGVTVQIGETKLQILQLRKEFNTEVVNQLAEAQGKLFDVRERIAAVEDRVRRAKVTAPVAGVVMGLGFHTLGGVVAPGNPILDIVPEDSTLLVEARVSPIDIDRVTTGMLSDIRLSAFKSALTPVIEGEVITVSADRLVAEDGAPYYLARVALKQSSLDALDGMLLVPGMPAEVLINTGSRTLLEYLVQPATDAFARSMIED